MPVPIDEASTTKELCLSVLGRNVDCWTLFTTDMKWIAMGFPSDGRVVRGSV